MQSQAQTVMTGAFNFSTDSSGAASGGEQWNTLGGDGRYNLWFARNADATSPINGPSDDQAGISIALQAGDSRKFYLFGQPGSSTGFNGLNLFFDGNNTIPGISAFGPTNGSSFSPNGASTYTLAAMSIVGSDTTFYTSHGVTAVLTGYGWNAPRDTSPDVCQAYVFSPGDGADFFGSFTLQVFPAAPLVVSPGRGMPGTAISIGGREFAPFETVGIYLRTLGLRPRYTVTADASGAFLYPTVEAQAPYGSEQYFALGQSSGKLGAATAVVLPRIVLSPSLGVPGSATNAQGVGFGAGEKVQIYWNDPRRLVGVGITDSDGGFVSDGVEITVPLTAAIGANGVSGVGETTKAVGLGTFTVE